MTSTLLKHLRVCHQVNLGCSVSCLEVVECGPNRYLLVGTSAPGRPGSVRVYCMGPVVANANSNSNAPTSNNVVVSEQALHSSLHGMSWISCL
jgi:hypothetical protein